MFHFRRSAAVALALTPLLLSVACHGLTPDKVHRKLVRTDAMLSQVSRREEFGKRLECDDANRAPCSTDCSRASPRCDYHSFANNVDGPWMPCCEKRQFVEMLGWFNNVVQSHVDNSGSGFWYSLVFGSLLGSARSGDMIDWDTDIDVAVPKEKIPWLQGLIQEAASKEDPPYVTSMDEDGSGGFVLRLHMSSSNEAHMDIWPAEGFEENAPCLKVGPHVSPSYGAFPLQSCAYGNQQVPCFARKEQYLQYWYGDAWNQKHTNKNNPAPAGLPAGCQSKLLVTAKGNASMPLSEIPDFD